jgi:glycine cleavage system H lipoate-binding protein
VHIKQDFTICSNFSGEIKMATLTKLVKVNESITINRYDNAWMVEISGRDVYEEWKTTKTVCNSEEELVALIKEYNMLDLDN